MARKSGILDNRCIAILEFALLAPVFVVTLAGVVDVGNAIYTRSRLEAALAVGANYAQVNLTQVSSSGGAALASDVASLVATSDGNPALDVTVVVNHGPTVTITGGVTAPTTGTAASADSCYCPTGSPSSWTWGSAVTCGNACGGTGTPTAGKFVTITASYHFTPLFIGYAFVTNGTMSAGAAVQTQ